MINMQTDTTSSYTVPVCNKCKHYIDGIKCKAFKEIPDQILDAENNHTKPFIGDNGIQFEPIEDKDA
tara:strand:+ start:2275 stop:2475 length:201 start_codon:yes stop_codon:yes gene_type:complete